MDPGRRAAIRRLIAGNESAGGWLSHGTVLQLLDALDEADYRIGADREHVSRMLVHFRQAVTDLATVTQVEGQTGFVSRDAVLMLLDMLAPSWDKRR